MRCWPWQPAIDLARRVTVLRRPPSLRRARFVLKHGLRFRRRHGRREKDGKARFHAAFKHHRRRDFHPPRHSRRKICRQYRNRANHMTSSIPAQAVSFMVVLIQKRQPTDSHSPELVTLSGESRFTAEFRRGFAFGPADKAFIRMIGDGRIKACPKCLSKFKKSALAPCCPKPHHSRCSPS